MNLERDVLSLMTTDKGMAVVVEEQMSAEVFEVPRNEEAYAWALDYFRRDQQPPTRDAFGHEFPGIELLAPEEVGESARWLVAKLQERYTTNQIQEALLTGARLSTVNPVAGLEELHELSGHALEQVGKGNQGSTADVRWRAKADKHADDILARQEGQRIADAKANGHRKIKLTKASDTQPQPVEWVWTSRPSDYAENLPPGVPDRAGRRIPVGELTIAAGREATGKSTFSAWLAARISTGALPGLWYGIPRRVLWVSREESWERVTVPRLMAHAADLSMVSRVEVEVSGVEYEYQLSLPADLTAFESAIVSHEVALVVFDPLLSVISGKLDSHNEAKMREALEPLSKVAQRTDSVMLGIGHFNKSESVDLAKLLTGSGAFKNVARAMFGFVTDTSAEDDVQRGVFTQAKNSLGRNDLSVRYHIETGDDAPSRLRDRDPDRGVSVRARRREPAQGRGRARRGACQGAACRPGKGGRPQDGIAVLSAPVHPAAPRRPR